MNPPTRALMSQLADVAKSDCRRFSELVRTADHLAAIGLDRDAAYRAALAVAS